MSDCELKGLSDNPLGRVTFDNLKFKSFFLENASLSFEDLSDKAKKGTLPEEVGSRVHSWRVLLGLLSLERDPAKWVATLRQQRERFYSIGEKYSIKSTKNLDPMMFNPLMNGTNNLWNEMLENKDMREVIHKDIVRTYQEYEFFKRKDIRDQIVSTLYYWSKTYPMFSYRQGMNEIIAVIYFAFYAEKADKNDEVDKLTDDEIISSDESLISFMFNQKHINADVFTVFERVMSMGIKELYGTIDDLSSIKSQIFGAKSNDKDRLFKWKHEVEQEEKERRAHIEKIYDNERKKSAVMRRCNRIYHNFLKRIDTEIYKHLVSIRLDPELQLMRWLRCLLCREFDIEISITLWDYIFCGIKMEHRTDYDFGEMYYDDDYHESQNDPLINLDFLCLAMIENIRDSLYHEDITTCLEVFFNYPEIKSASKMIAISTKIESAIVNNEKFVKNTLVNNGEDRKIVEEFKEKLEAQQYEVVLKAEKPTITTIKTEDKPSFFDPLSDSILNFIKPTAQNIISTINSKIEEAKSNFPKKFIPDNSHRSDSDSAEDLDDFSPQNSSPKKVISPVEKSEQISQKPAYEQNPIKRIPASTWPNKPEYDPNAGFEPIVVIRTDLDLNDKEEEVKHHKHPKAASFTSGNDIMSHINKRSQGFQNEKGFQGDPLNKGEVKNITGKSNESATVKGKSKKLLF